MAKRPYCFGARESWLRREIRESPESPSLYCEFAQPRVNNTSGFAVDKKEVPKIVLDNLDKIHRDPSHPTTTMAQKLFVYGVSKDCPRDILEGKFRTCGEVDNVFNTGKGYAFVTMRDKDSAEKAVKKLRGVVVNGKKIKVLT